MARRRGQTVATSMPHCKAYSPARYCEITGARRAPRHHQDPKLSSALEYAKHKTNLGYRLFVEFTRDFPMVRDAYGGEDLKRYDSRRRMIREQLKHRGGKYMAQFAGYMCDMCETAVRAYRKRRAYNPGGGPLRARPIRNTDTCVTQLEYVGVSYLPCCMPSGIWVGST